MFQPMQTTVPRPPRAERMTTSCGECRRRKQKCNQAQPCSNCARRFPQPICEYKQNHRRRTNVLLPQQPGFFVSPSSSNPNQGGIPNAGDLRQHFPLENFPPGFSRDQQRSHGDPGNALPDWPSFGLPDQHPSSAPALDGQYSWSTDQQSLSMVITACQDGCASHSAEVHHAIRTLRAYRSAQDGWTSASWSQGQEISAWTLVPVVLTEPDGQGWPISDPVQESGRVLSARSIPDQDLLMVFTHFLTQFTASLDGNPEPSNPYIKYYVPYCVNSRLLVHVAIYSAACFLTDTGHVGKAVAMAHKCHVFRLLNDHIRIQVPTTDEVIAGVIQIILNEWLWGNTDDLRAHLRGLRDMIRCRGGFRMLGLHGLISKLAISADVAISLSFEVPPYLRGGPELEFSDSSPSPPHIALNTPLVPTLVRFSSCADTLHIHSAVAAILDDMRFLLAAVLSLPEKPSAKELQKIHTTSAWIHERILGLPEETPTTLRPPEAGLAPRAEDTIGTEISKQTQPTQALPLPQHRQPTSEPPRARIRTPTNLTQEPYRTTDVPPSYSPSLSPSLPPDHIYQVVRLAALIYSRAIMHRRPFSRVVTSDIFLRLWTTAWRVPLSTWRSLLGVFTWILLPLVPGGGKAAQPHGRFMRGMLYICMFQMGIGNWEIASSAMESGLRLQQWLAGGPANISETSK